MPAKHLIPASCLPVLALVLVSGAVRHTQADDFDSFLQPLVASNCIRCHGEEDVNGDVDFKEITTAQQLIDRPKLIQNMIEVIDANDMPPEGEPELQADVREELLTTLRTMLREATAGEVVRQVRIRRLNRFQYNNAVRDLFRLNRDVFELPEKLMTRHSNYLNAGSGPMPDRVEVASHALNPAAGLSEVKAFPKDLRASHGFDNQANQLTLSPLLLDAFLRLSVSIVESPDFNEQNVGIWNEFFSAPAEGQDNTEEVRRRLQSFLRLAFRGSVDGETLDRYTAYAVARLNSGMPFSDAMKKVASAALSSPLFLYRTGSADQTQDQFELASNLSFFLWSSIPDAELLRLADSGELASPEALNKTIDRMFADPKIERFLDTFPSQWMQLENVLAATPDPQQQRLFSLDKDNPASLQMVLEPLLLFDAVFIEDRSIVELISPEFSYQSEFLRDWYTSDLTPPRIDAEKIRDENLRNEARRKQLEEMVATARAELKSLVKPVKSRILAARNEDGGLPEPVDLQPYAAWEFDGDLNDAVNSLDLTAHGDIRFEDGMVVLERSYLLSKTLPVELKAKSLEVWFQLHDLNQNGGGLMGIQGPGDFFDTIVLGERQAHHWISGSNGFSRTKDFPGSIPEDQVDQMLHLVMVYQADGTTTLYRNGKPYGEPFRKDQATFPTNNTSVIFGLRHLPPGGNKYLNVRVDKARFYNRALTAAEVAASHTGTDSYVTDEELWQALTSAQQARHRELTGTLEQSMAALKAVPEPQDPATLQADAERRFDDEIRNRMRSRSFSRVVASDPRYGGVITNAAMLSMTSGPKRTHPIARGAWVIEVIFNDPPPPPPNDVPPLNEENSSEHLTIREKFAVHRENPDCAGCHSRLDPLGFALENFDITGRWRDKYENGREVDSGGTLMRKYAFKDVVQFKASLVQENRRLARAFTAHLMRFALSRELRPADALTIDSIVNKTEQDGFRLRSLIRQVALSDRFLQAK